jgi:hypothetical protein
MEDLQMTFPEPDQIEGFNEAITQQWKEARLGKFTASTNAKLLGKGTGGKEFTAGALTMIYKKAAEILTQDANEVSGAAIKWGEEHEPIAAKRFTDALRKNVEYYGKENPVFIDHPDIDGAGGSPDLWVPEEEAVGEIKCPYESGYHMEVLHRVKTGAFDLAEYDKDYYGQLQFNMKLKNAKFGYFISFDPRVLDAKMCLVFVRVERNDEYIKAMEPKVKRAVEVRDQYLTEVGFYSEENKAAA